MITKSIVTGKSIRGFTIASVLLFCSHFSVAGVDERYERPEQEKRRNIDKEMNVLRESGHEYHLTEPLCLEPLPALSEYDIVFIPPVQTKMLVESDVLCLVLEPVQAQKMDVPEVSFQTVVPYKVLPVQVLAEPIRWNRLEIKAHDSRRESEKNNLELSRKREEAVRGYLIEHGVTKNHLFVIGHDECPDGSEGDKNQFIVTDAVGKSIEVPENFYLSQNYPNPFNPAIWFDYTVPEDSRIQLEVFNVLGQKVATLADTHQSAGFYTVHWDTDGMPSGTYFCRLTAGSFSSTRKMSLVK